MRLQLPFQMSLLPPAVINFYRFMTAPMRQKQQEQKTTTERSVVVDYQNRSILYVVARRCRKARKLAPNEAAFRLISEFEKQLYSVLYDIENSHLTSKKLSFHLHYEFDIWRSTWIELVMIAQESKQIATKRFRISDLQ